MDGTPQTAPGRYRERSPLTHADAIQFAELAAKEFKVGESKTVPFDKQKAKQDVTDGGDAKTKPKKGSKGKKGEETNAE